MRKGLLVLALVGLTTWLVAHTIPAVLIVLCVTLVLLPPSIDPAIQIKDRQTRNDNDATRT